MTVKSLRAVVARWSPVLVVTALAACGPSQKVQQQIADLQKQAAQKDSLMQEVAENAKVMSQIASQIAQVQGQRATPGQEGTPPASSDSIIAGIQTIGARLDSTETRLALSERRMRRLIGQNASLKKSMEDLQTAIANQKVTIATLNDQVNSLKEQNAQLAAANQALGDTVQGLVTKENTVYYVIGTKKKLMSEGLVRQEGGHRVLFIFGKRGQVLVPARNLDPGQFTAIDMRETTEIPLPDPNKSYRIVSRQDVSGLATPPGKDGKITGSIQIADPQKFWANSPMLIIVQAS